MPTNRICLNGQTSPEGESSVSPEGDDNKVLAEESKQFKYKYGESVGSSN